MTGPVHEGVQAPAVAPAPAPAWRRRAAWAFGTACVLWLSYYPLRMDRLYRAIPESTILASYHRGLAGEWKHLARRDDLTAMLLAAGVEDAPDWRDDAGIYQTLFWLTGRHTVFGLEAGPDLEPSRIALHGASYVGWKARPMELLWRIRWIPGLGRLDVTPSGTRYLVFRRSRTMRKLGLVLSLDIYEGVLLGVLSSDPDAVRELAFRIRHDADAPEVFGDPGEPWKTPPATPHRFWVPRWTTAWAAPGLGPWAMDVASFAGPTLRIDACGLPDFAAELAQGGRFGEAAEVAGPALAADAPFAALAFPGAWLKRLPETGLPLWPEGGFAPGVASLMVCGKPYEGRLLGLAVPSVTLRMPWMAGTDAEAWSRQWTDRLSQWGKLGPVLLRPCRGPEGRNVLLLDAAKASVLARAADEDCVFLEAADGALVLGSHLGSHARQGPDPAAPERRFTLADEAVRSRPEVSAWAWVDLPRAYAEFRQLAAIVRLGTRLSGSDSAGKADRVLGQVLRGLYAASALGDASVWVTAQGNTVGLRIETRPRPVAVGSPEE